jgi:transcriptional regulator with XRE-family HTH domain
MYNKGMKVFSERLMELRKEKGLSQATVAKDLGVSLGIVCYWETNKSDPTASNIAKVARYLNVTSDYLLGLSD